LHYIIYFIFSRMAWVMHAFFVISIFFISNEVKSCLFSVFTYIILIYLYYLHFYFLYV
jgi:hypothetical protein